MAKAHCQNFSESIDDASGEFLRSEIDRQALEIATLTRLLEVAEKQASSIANASSYRAAAREVATREAQGGATAAFSAAVLAAHKILATFFGPFVATRLTERIVSRSKLFDPAWYLDQYPDVRSSGQAPLKHYVRYGAAELRFPNRGFLEAFEHSRPQMPLAEAGESRRGDGKNS
jgi:hypothetical protein